MEERRREMMTRMQQKPMKTPAGHHSHLPPLSHFIYIKSIPLIPANDGTPDTKNTGDHLVPRTLMRIELHPAPLQ